MKTNLLMDFTIDKENRKAIVKREFAANLQLVWDAWTKPEILDQWWAPKPYKAVTKSMDFKVGGCWKYSMCGPNGEVHNCIAEYHSITPLKNYKGLDAFCDEEWNINEDFPRSNWDVTFVEQNGITLVHIETQYKKLEDLEMVIKMGFKEGFTMALQNLDQYIESQFRLRKQNKTNNKARVSSYLNFAGNTEEAFNFYKAVFKTNFINGIKRFGDIPADAGHPPIADIIKTMVLHVELPIVGGHILMGTDAPKEMGFKLTQGNNMHICIEPETRQEADRLFNELSAGGNITMPMEDMFFGAYFGEFSDKFGINWMINYQNNDL